MKILYYVHGLTIGGAQTIVTEYAVKLSALGENVVIVVNERVDSFMEKNILNAGVKIISLFPQYSHSFWGKVKRRAARRCIDGGKRFNKIIQQEQPDIIHINTSMDWLGRVNFPIEKMFYTFHTEVERDLAMKGSLHREIFLKNAKKGMNIFVLSQQMLMDAKKKIHSEKIYYMPNGIDIKEIQKGTVPVTQLREQLNIPQDAFVLGHVGRIHPVKNHQKVIEIFSEVRKIKSNAYLVLIGDGKAKYVDEIRKMVYQNGLEDYVIFAGARDDAAILMNMFNAFVLPSFKEGFPLVAIEAQIHHVRTVLSNAVPDEAICNENCFKLDIHENSKVWAEYAAGDFVSENVKDIEEYDINVILKKLITYYQMAVDA